MSDMLRAIGRAAAPARASGTRIAASPRPNPTLSLHLADDQRFQRV
jgi:hypothetical protein